MTYKKLIADLFDWTIIITMWIAILATFAWANYGCYLAAAGCNKIHNVVILGIFLYAVTTHVYAWAFNGLYSLSRWIRENNLVYWE